MYLFLKNNDLIAVGGTVGHLPCDLPDDSNVCVFFKQASLNSF